MFGDAVAQLPIEQPDGLSLKIGLRVEQRERALFLG